MKNKLIDELLENPIKFSKSKRKGYYLLEEFQKGLDLEQLVVLLENNNLLIVNIGVSISSELKNEQCSYLLPYLLPLKEKIYDSLYFHYLIESISKGTLINNNEFFNIVNVLFENRIEFVICAMHSIFLANENQLKNSLEYFQKLNHNICKNLLLLINYKDLDNNKIIELLNNQEYLDNLFGVIIAHRLYEIKPILIIESYKSPNETVIGYLNDYLRS
ncbi:hypothetical protein [Flavobacterium branchiophilum]|uniref:Uncharacterized protein n=1 Tax=Flavobacterium branchiophilum TaxID=55197 RepID=A0A2H3KA30_9FLAO|nr:hypothetical protein [Flavobacterium branchiophilum]PDS21955.1 hypothetical protein B0A77_14730 [Flavobacterium branchiophilum]